GGEAEVVDAFAYRRGQRARIGDLIRIETAERSCLDGHADANFDAEPVDKGGETRRGGLGQSPDLEAAARGDLQHPVAETTGRASGLGKLAWAKRPADRIEPCEQPVACRHWRRQRWAGAAARWC